MTARETAAIIAPMSRVDRAAGRMIRDRERSTRRSGRRATQAAVGAHEDLIARLTLAHQVAFEPVDWQTIVALGTVAPAVKRDAISAGARRALASYQPSIFETLLGLEADKRRKLTAQVVEAAKADAEAYGQALAAAEAHNRLLKLAPEVAALKPEAIAAVLKASHGLEALRGAVEGLLLEGVRGRLIAHLDLLELEALPDEACVERRSGVPAFAVIPMIERQQLHLSSACSVVLRTALEVLRAAPVEAVEVVARLYPAEGLGGGSLEPVLYVKVPLAVLRRLDLSKIEAASAMAALNARVDWDSSRGFAPIRVDDLELSPEPSGSVAA